MKVKILFLNLLIIKNHNQHAQNIGTTLITDPEE